MKNLYDKEIKEKVSQKQDFDENKDEQTTQAVTKESTVEADLPLQDLPRRDPTAEGILSQDQC